MKYFTFDQQNLDLLSEDVSLETNEIHIQNDYYGQASILKSNFLKLFKTLYAVSEHGVSFDDEIWHIDKNADLKTSVVFSEFRKKIYKENTSKYCFNIGNIIDYVELPIES